MPSPATLVEWIKRGLDIPRERAQFLAEKTVPALTIGDVSRWWENDSRVIRPASGWYTKAAVAGLNSHIALVNPVTSGVDCLCTGFTLCQNESDPLFYEIITTTEAEIKALTGAAQGTTLTGYTDLRSLEEALAPSSAARRTVGQMWAGAINPQADGHRIMKVVQKISTSQRYNLVALLPPGTALCIVCLTVNMTISAVDFDWTERRIPR